MEVEPKEKNKSLAKDLDVPRFTGEFIWKWIGAFFVSTVMWTNRVGTISRYGALFRTSVILLPLLSDEFRQSFYESPLLIGCYAGLVMMVIAQSALRMLGDHKSYFYSEFAEFLFFSTHYEERKRWEEKMAPQLEEMKWENRLLQDKLATSRDEYLTVAELASKLGGELRLYESIIYHPYEIQPDLLLDRLHKEMSEECFAIAYYEREGEMIHLSGSAGAPFQEAFSMEEETPEVECILNEEDVISQNATYPYEYSYSMKVATGCFVSIFRMDSTDKGIASSRLYDIMMEKKHLLLIASRILSSRKNLRQAVKPRD
ncbi:hypothetical protein [Mechercharimyces sp. CAU 1602]|uniref:hypothetical protein n=1 Tax=Mechercharimyces sp. CAU 1602 TaxID=2973933 RepID=UPI002163FA04|nr:hypothetical protein [Mechercharimyces sp. CAU 1602]MCS1350178.1 hypothetical protein [Mechercharimyces sp. CAU 1602]